MRSILLVPTLAAFLLAGCGADASDKNSAEKQPAEQQQQEKKSDEGNPPIQPVPEEFATSHVHDVLCGCAIDAIGKCGNYIVVDGAPIPLKAEGLGPMEFCKKDGLKAEVAGKVDNGEFVATSFKLVK